MTNKERIELKVLRNIRQRQAERIENLDKVIHHYQYLLRKHKIPFKYG